MIYRNGKLITQVHSNIKEIVDQVQQRVQRNIGAIYKGAQLVWLTVYDAIRSCFGSGTWLSDRPWLKDDSWKNN